MRSAFLSITPQSPSAFFFADVPPVHPSELLEPTPTIRVVERWNQDDCSLDTHLLGKRWEGLHLHDGCCIPTTADAESDRVAEVVESLIRARLLQALETIESPELRAQLLQASRNDKELLEILREVHSSERVGVALDLINASVADDYTKNFFVGKLDNILFFLSPEEKILLFENIATHKRSSYAALLLKNARSFEELQALATQLPAIEPRILSDNTVQSHLAKARVLELTSPYVELLEAYSSDTLSLSKQEVLNVFCDIRQILERDGLKDSLAGQQTLTAIADTERRLLRDLAIHPQQYEHTLKREAKTLRIELLYGVNISYGESDILGLMKRDTCDYADFGIADVTELEHSTTAEELRWTLDELEKIEDVLRAVSFKHMHFTEKLFDIELVPSLGRGVLGARYHIDGRIKLADVTRNNSLLEWHYEGVSSLKIVLAHELGHSLQIGGGSAGFRSMSAGGYEFSPGEPDIDFHDFIALSGWTVIDPERVSLRGAPWSVTIDGNDYPLEQPVTLNDKEVVLLYVGWAGLVISFDSNAEFSSRWYAKVSPWEDFAEAFSEYLYLPERLLADAPEKFWHLELEFRRYQEDDRFYSR